MRHSDLGRRVAVYAASALLATLVYVAWLVVSIAFGAGNHPGFIFPLEFAVIFLFAGGFAPALVLMFVPWALALWVQLKMRWDGRIYFPAAGALLVFICACAAGSLAPKPFWVDSQTFLEGAALTADRQGVCLLVCGIAFGVCYAWLERKFSAPSRPVPAVIPKADSA